MVLVFGMQRFSAPRTSGRGRRTGLAAPAGCNFCALSASRGHALPRPRLPKCDQKGWKLGVQFERKASKKSI
eukprot:5268322-Amphidinium_carterae.2